MPSELVGEQAGWQRSRSIAARIASAPCALKASQSFSARNGREYSSVMSTVSSRAARGACSPPRVPKAPCRSSRRRTSTDAAGLRQEEPLVGVERHRVGSLEPGEQVPGGRRRRGRDAVGAVDVEPDVARGAHVGQRLDRVNRAGQGRSRGRDDRHGARCRAAVGIDRACATSAGRSRRRSSCGSTRTCTPSRSRAARRPGATESVRLGRARRPRRASPSTPVRREPGSARSRAAASAVTLLSWPPLVNAPAPTG